VARVPACGIVPKRPKRVGRTIIMKLAYPHPPVVANRLESFSMNKTDFRMSGTITIHGLGALGKTSCVAGSAMPVRVITAVFAAITFNPFSV
jgi:hypothetical protein